MKLINVELFIERLEKKVDDIVAEMPTDEYMRKMAQSQILGLHYAMDVAEEMANEV